MVEAEHVNEVVTAIAESQQHTQNTKQRAAIEQILSHLKFTVSVTERCEAVTNQHLSDQSHSCRWVAGGSGKEFAMVNERRGEKRADATRAPRHYRPPSINLVFFPRSQAYTKPSTQRCRPISFFNSRFSP